jgi:hypothetical protein
MPTNDYFLTGTAASDSGPGMFAATVDNDVTVFVDNRLFFTSILQDLNSTTAPKHFIYFVGWWTDIDIPLDDPKAQATPPTFQAVLSTLAKGTPKAPGATNDACVGRQKPSIPDRKSVVWSGTKKPNSLESWNFFAGAGARRWRRCDLGVAERGRAREGVRVGWTNRAASD